MCSISSKTISNHLISLKPYIPLEFNRKPRGLSDIAKWKATEYRTFLLYIGVIVLKNNVDLAIYEHFMLLNTAITIFLSYAHINNNMCSLGGELLNNFVEHGSKSYGHEFLIYNVHYLCHIKDDYLGTLKDMIKQPDKPLQQVYCRLFERQSVLNSTLPNLKGPQYSHFDGPLLDIDKTSIEQYLKLNLDLFTLCTYKYSPANSYIFSKKFSLVFQIHNIVKVKNKFFVICKKFKDYDNLYNYPFPSTQLYVYKVRHLSDEYVKLCISDISAKCMILPIGKDFFASFPIVHTLK